MENRFRINATCRLNDNYILNILFNFRIPRKLIRKFDIIT